MMWSFKEGEKIIQTNNTADNQRRTDTNKPPDEDSLTFCLYSEENPSNINFKSHILQTSNRISDFQ